jgi:excisionase family DNA binding protein
MDQKSQIILQGVSTEALLDAVREIVKTEIRSIPQPEKQREYLTFQQALDFTGFSQSKLYQLTCAKRVPHIKTGGKILFKTNELCAWLESSRQPVEESA